MSEIVKRLISFFSRKVSPQASAVPQESAVLQASAVPQEKYTHFTRPGEYDAQQDLRNRGLKTSAEYEKEIWQSPTNEIKNNPTFAHYFRDEEFAGLQPRAQVGGISLEPAERETTSFEFEGRIQPKPKPKPEASPTSIESAPQTQTLPDNVLDSFNPSPSEESRLGNMVEGTYIRGGLTIPSTAPRPPPAQAGTVQELQEAQTEAPPPLLQPEAPQSVSTPPPLPVSRNAEPQVAPTQTAQSNRPAEPISDVPDYAPLTDDEEATGDIQDTSGVALTASKASNIAESTTNVAEEGEKAVTTAGKTIAGASSFLAGSEGFVNPILDGIGLIGGLAGLLMGSGLFSKKPPAPTPISIPKPPALVIPSISQEVGGGQI